MKYGKKLLSILLLGCTLLTGCALDLNTETPEQQGLEFVFNLKMHESLKQMFYGIGSIRLHGNMFIDNANNETALNAGLYFDGNKMFELNTVTDADGNIYGKLPAVSETWFKSNETVVIDDTEIELDTNAIKKDLLSLFNDLKSLKYEVNVFKQMISGTDTAWMGKTMCKEYKARDVMYVLQNYEQTLSALGMTMEDLSIEDIPEDALFIHDEVYEEGSYKGHIFTVKSDGVAQSIGFIYSSEDRFAFVFTSDEYPADERPTILRDTWNVDSAIEMKSYGIDDSYEGVMKIYSQNSYMNYETGAVEDTTEITEIYYTRSGETSITVDSPYETGYISSVFDWNENTPSATFTFTDNEAGGLMEAGVRYFKDYKLAETFCNIDYTGVNFISMNAGIRDIPYEDIIIPTDVLSEDEYKSRYAEEGSIKLIEPFITHYPGLINSMSELSGPMYMN